MKRYGVISAALLIGIGLGRFGVPIIEGNYRYAVVLVQDKQRGCAIRMGVDKLILGRRISTTEDSTFAECGKVVEISPETLLKCDCEGSWMK